MEEDGNIEVASSENQEQISQSNNEELNTQIGDTKIINYF